MTIKTVQLSELIVIVRRGFEPRLGPNGQPTSDRDGQPEFIAEAVIPGLVGSAAPRSLEQAKPELVRLRAVGRNPGFEANSVIRLAGQVTATAWYRARERGSKARSNLTVTAERFELATGQRPAVRGGLPAMFPADVPAMLLGATEEDTPGTSRWLADLMFASAGIYTVDGLAEVHVLNRPADDLIGQDVLPVDLRAYFTVPDEQDASAYSKAELILVASAFEAVRSTNGKGRSKPEPASVGAGDPPPEG